MTRITLALLGAVVLTGVLAPSLMQDASGPRQAYAATALTQTAVSETDVSALAGMTATPAQSAYGSASRAGGQRMEIQSAAFSLGGGLYLYAYQLECKIFPHWDGSGLEVPMGGNAPIAVDIDGSGPLDTSFHVTSPLGFQPYVADLALFNNFDPNYVNLDDDVNSAKFTADKIDFTLIFGDLFETSPVFGFVTDAPPRVVSGAFAVGSSSVFELVAPSPEAPSRDSDGDGWNDDIEGFLGSDASDSDSTPEHSATYSPVVATLPCSDGVDNDGDGSTDGQDEGCVKPPLFTETFPPAGFDIFASHATVQVDPDDPESAEDFYGPTVIERQEPVDTNNDGRPDHIQLEIVAMQLTSLSGLQLTEDPVQQSLGEVNSLDSSSEFPAQSFFDVVFAELLACEFPGGCSLIRAPQPFLDVHLIQCLPPAVPDCHGSVPSQLCYENEDATVRLCAEGPGDSDGDGCLDERENGPDETLGGQRDYLNPYDFYDVAGGGGGPPDQIIDLSNDILGVILHYAPMGTEPEYDVNYDRGPSTGPNPWNMTAPDGVIDLSNDILGVIFQYLHDCR